MPNSESPAGPYRLSVEAPDQSTRIEIYDGNQRPVTLAHNLGSVSAQVAPGVYTVRFHQGRNYTEKFAALLPEQPEATVKLGVDEQPAFAAAAPVQGTTTADGPQGDAARILSRSAAFAIPAHPIAGSEAMIFLRNPFPDGSLPTAVTVHDLDGSRLFDLDSQGTGEPVQKWRGAVLALKPGAYRLRTGLAQGSFLEQIFFTCSGWQTQIFLLAAETRPQEITRRSLFLTRIGTGFDPTTPELTSTEAALRSLSSPGNVPGADDAAISSTLSLQPMLSLYAALLHLRRPDANADVLQRVFDHLLGLVGPLPDVIAVGHGLSALAGLDPQKRLALTAKLQEYPVYGSPPMLRESWGHLLRANATQRELIPRGSVADRVGGRLIAGTPWTTWLGELPVPVAGQAVPPEVSFMSMAADVQTATGGLGTAIKLVRGFLGLFEKAQSATLQFGLPTLALVLRRQPDARFWLTTPRFSDLERSLAYWLVPSLDPRLGPLFKADPKLEAEVKETAKNRGDDEGSLLEELHVSATTVLRTAWNIYDKLFVSTVIPRASHVAEFTGRESQHQVVYRNLFKHFGRQPSPFQRAGREGRQPVVYDGTFKNFAGLPSAAQLSSAEVQLDSLQLVYLLYCGSPAEENHPSPDLALLAERLTEARFGVGGDTGVGQDELRNECDRLRRVAIKFLRNAKLPRGHVLVDDWQTLVMPPPEEYQPGKLLPPVVRIRKNTHIDKSANPPAPPPIESEGGAAAAF